MLAVKRWSGESSEEDTSMQGGHQVHKELPGNVRECRVVFFILISVGAMCLTSVISYRFLIVEQNQTHTHFTPETSFVGKKPGLESHPTVLALLQSNQLQQAVADACVRLSRVAAQLQLQDQDSHPHVEQAKNTTAGFRQQPTKAFAKGSSTETQHLRAEAKLSFKESLFHFFNDHSDAQEVLHDIRITTAQSKTVLAMLERFTDERLLDLSLDAARAIHEYGAGKRSLASIVESIHRGLRHRMPEVQRLRQEIIPENLRTLTDNIKRKHFQMLEQRGLFEASGEAEGWHASFKLSRLLQSMDFPQPASVNPIHTPRLSTAPHVAPAQTSTPINWFTIGAPVTSNLIGLMFWSLMGLLPATEGQPTKQVGNYAIWGLQGATTVGECLANIGYAQGIIYFAPCIIDMMFFAVEVLWVFFDNPRDDGPVANVQCSNYSGFSAIDNFVCGNCLALVPAGPFQARCDFFCESFGHSCIFAAEEVMETCHVQQRYACDEAIPQTSDMLCQCQQNNKNSEGCASYSMWPEELENACGNCEAVVSVEAGREGCDDVCFRFDHVCVSAYEALSESCSSRNNSIDCDRRIQTNFAVCQCEKGEFADDKEARCAPYSQWPSIDGQVCGQCTAVVSRQRRGQERETFTDCNTFCQTFDHVCTSAFRLLQGESCPDVGESFRQEINCSMSFVSDNRTLCECTFPSTA